MVIRIDRRNSKADYTIGELFIDEVFVCNTLEPTDRGLDGQQPVSYIKEVKKQGKTAVPAGRYSVVLSMSSKFRAVRPYLIGVPGYAGVMIHEGNTIRDTLGCILVGNNTQCGMVLNSRKSLKVIMDRIALAESRKEPVVLDIR